MTYKDLFGNYLRTVKEICITAPFIRQPYQIRLKSQKSERISPFWVGGYPPFSADKTMLATSNSDGKATKEKGAKPMKIAYFFCSLKRNRQIFISRNLIPKNF